MDKLQFLVLIIHYAAHVQVQTNSAAAAATTITPV